MKLSSETRNYKTGRKTANIYEHKYAFIQVQRGRCAVYSVLFLAFEHILFHSQGLHNSSASWIGSGFEVILILRNEWRVWDNSGFGACHFTWLSISETTLSILSQDAGYPVRWKQIEKVKNTNNPLGLGIVFQFFSLP